MLNKTLIFGKDQFEEAGHQMYCSWFGYHYGNGIVVEILDEKHGEIWYQFTEGTLLARSKKLEDVEHFLLTNGVL